MDHLIHHMQVLSKAITVANGIATLANPICILISAGIYIENNSAGPLNDYC